LSELENLVGFTERHVKRPTKIYPHLESHAKPSRSSRRWMSMARFFNQSINHLL